MYGHKDAQDAQRGLWAATVVRTPDETSNGALVKRLSLILCLLCLFVAMLASGSGFLWAQSAGGWT